MMMGHAREIDWDDMKIAFPSFLTIVLMPLSYSIAYGVLTGILANITLWLFLGLIDIGRALWRRDGVTTPRTVSGALTCNGGRTKHSCTDVHRTDVGPLM